MSNTADQKISNVTRSRLTEVSQRIADLINRGHEIKELQQHREDRFLRGLGVILRTPRLEVVTHESSANTSAP